MPVAIAATRWSQTYTLIDAAFAIPIGVALGVLAVVLARRGRLRIDRTLGRTGGRRQAATGRLLGILGFCLAVTGIKIQHESTIGPGLVVHTFGNILILVKRMGHSCTVNSGVVLANVRGSGRPTIGNNCYFGAGCKVLGGVTIGDNVVVSANSLVIADVPSNCTMMGVPARIISREPVSPYLEFPVETT